MCRPNWGLYKHGTWGRRRWDTPQKKHIPSLEFRHHFIPHLQDDPKTGNYKKPSMISHSQGAVLVLVPSISRAPSWCHASPGPSSKMSRGTGFFPWNFPRTKYAEHTWYFHLRVVENTADCLCSCLFMIALPLNCFQII